MLKKRMVQDYLKLLSNLIDRGKFLDSINDTCFDREKSEFEFKVLTVLENILKLSFTSKNNSFSITLADIILKVDPLNEMALECKIISFQKIGHNEKAKKVFNSFLISEKLNSSITTCPYSEKCFAKLAL